MKKIVLSTFNARYTHTSLGLRYLYANLKEYKEDTIIKEFVIKSSVADALEEILKEAPHIVGLGAYIWNATEISQLAGMLKLVRPDVTLILGGPEASYLPHRVDFSKADFIIQGEGDVAFYKLCKSLFENKKPSQRFIKASVVDLNSIELPYDAYSEHDINNRYMYIEASRGCPFSCEFCLSSLDKKVRQIEKNRFLEQLEKLWGRGVRNFKFIDRTFNLDINTACDIMDFFLAKEPPYFVHFEVIPEHFPESIKERIKKFPPASLQLEVGIQTLHGEIAKNINRKLNIPKIKENLYFLENQTKAHLHVDLIVGLPGESLEAFGANLDMLYSMCKSEIQIGILKKLSGTTLNRHDEIHAMVYSQEPPYDILQNGQIDFFMMQKMKRFARFWDLFYNSGNFQKCVRLLFKEGRVFEGFFAFSEWIYRQTESTWKISLDRLAYLLFTYLNELVSTLDEQSLKELIIEDINVVEGRKLPKFLRTNKESKKNEAKSAPKFNKRQQKHSS